jgi:hypothetical protein
MRIAGAMDSASLIVSSRSLTAGTASTDGSFDAFDQVGCSKGLGEKTNGSGLQRAVTDSVFGEGRNEDKRYTVPRVLVRMRRSNPLIPGICTSATTHEESCKRGDCRNSSADANVRTKYPCELRRLSIAARTDASSSIIEITESI